MKRTIPRSALVVSCAVAVAALSAGSAGAAVTAVTAAPTAVTADSATFNGSIVSGGAATAWEFSYSLASNPFVGSETAGGSIPVGTSGTTIVLATATGLIPSTTYTVQLLANPLAPGFTYPISVIFGGPLTFTTKGAGSASLTSTKLKVTNGRVAVGIKCASTLTCKGLLAITTRHKSKKVNCGSTSFTVIAGKKKKITTSKVSATCKALLVLATKNKIDAHLVAALTTFQKPISKGVTLTLVP
jgi:hypothetical protein